MGTPVVFAVLVNWKTCQDTLRAVESLGEQTLKPEILVVDNDSSDGSEQKLRSALAGRATVLQTGDNLGWAGGCNYGIRYALAAGADYVWLFNNDAVADPQALDALVDAAEQSPKAATCGSLIYELDAPEVVCFAGGGISRWRGLTWHQGMGDIDRGQFQTPMSVDYVTGCSMLIRRAAFEQVGLLPEDYFLYYEDSAWCLKAHRLGWQSLFVPTSRVWHRQGTSSREAGGLSPTHAYYDTRNNLYFIERQCNPLQRLTATGWFTVRKLAKAAYWLLLRRKAAQVLLPPTIAAVGDYLRRQTGRRATPAQRRRSE